MKDIIKKGKKYYHKYKVARSKRRTDYCDHGGPTELIHWEETITKEISKEEYEELLLEGKNVFSKSNNINIDFKQHYNDIDLKLRKSRKDTTSIGIKKTINLINKIIPLNNQLIEEFVSNVKNIDRYKYSAAYISDLEHKEDLNINRYIRLNLDLKKEKFDLNFILEQKDAKKLIKRNLLLIKESKERIIDIDNEKYSEIYINTMKIKEKEIQKINLDSINLLQKKYII